MGDILVIHFKRASELYILPPCKLRSQLVFRHISRLQNVFPHLSICYDVKAQRFPFCVSGAKETQSTLGKA